MKNNLFSKVTVSLEGLALIAALEGCAEPEKKLRLNTNKSPIEMSEPNQERRVSYNFGDAIVDKDTGNFWRFEKNGWREYTAKCKPTKEFIEATSEEFIIGVTDLLKEGETPLHNYNPCGTFNR